MCPQGDVFEKLVSKQNCLWSRVENNNNNSRSVGVGGGALLLDVPPFMYQSAAVWYNLEVPKHWILSSVLAAAGEGGCVTSLVSSLNRIKVSSNCVQATTVWSPISVVAANSSASQILSGHNQLDLGSP